MVQESRKDVSAAKNEAFKERFQFILYSNDNIVCQRYFRISGYNSGAIGSVELFDALEWCVNAIKEDLWSKSLDYQTVINNNPIKAMGFAPDVDVYEDACAICSSTVSGNIKLSDGRVIEKTFIEPTLDADKTYGDDEKLNPWDVTFKFEFRVDDRPVYERIWDGTVYPKHIRNSVDLANAGSDADPSKVYLNSIDGVLQYIKIGRPNLIYQIIKKIISAMSGGHYESGRFISDRDYNYTVQGYDAREFVMGWEKVTSDKTRKYKNWVYNRNVFENFKRN